MPATAQQPRGPWLEFNSDDTETFILFIYIWDMC